MPLLKRKPLQKANNQERLKDSDEVFVCETTGELFSDYDDFFNRIMLLSSTVWSCAMTGRNNLTYEDALESEKAAKRSLKSFPAALKGPILLIASRTKRTSIRELASDVHGYAKDVFFKGETVHTRTGDPETIRAGRIVRVVISELPSEHENPSRLIYHVVSNDDESPTSYTVRGDAVTRERNCLSREKCKLFLKQHVELGPNQVLCVKKASLEQFVTSKGFTDDKVFYGQMPDFGVSKKLLKKENLSSNVVGKKKEGGTGEKQAPAKEKKGKKVKATEDGKKQQSIAKYMQATTEELEALNKKKFDAKNARAEEREQKKALAKEREIAEKTILLKYVETALKELNSPGEDQELIDQRVLPSARPLHTAIGEENFPNFMFILEFLDQFSDILSIEERFPKGVTMEILEQALLDRAMNGPLNDILQLLLSALFTAMKDAHDKTKHPVHSVTRVFGKDFAPGLNSLPMDSTTVTELLRLYLSSYSQQVHFGEPCYTLLREQPQLMRTLAMHSIFDLPTKSVMQIICALIHQLLLSGEVLERVEKVGEGRMKMISNRLERQRLQKKTKELKGAAKTSMNLEMLSLLVGDRPGEPVDNGKVDEGRKVLQQKLDEELTRIDAEASEKLAELLEEHENLKVSYLQYQVYLGSDRGYRHYWQFQSLPGVFVEHDRSFAETCPGPVTVNVPRLAQCEGSVHRKKLITEAILKCGGNSNGLLEGAGAEGKGPTKDVCVQLLKRGISLLEKSEARKKNPFEQAKAGSAVMDTDANKMETDAPEKVVPPIVPPTNRELFMCTGNQEDCPVHAPGQQTTWSYYATAEELDALIASLNMYGVREKSLRLSLEQYRDELVLQIKKCPIKRLSIQETSDRPPIRSTRQANGQRGEPPKDELDCKFRCCLVEMEGKITVGGLGNLKVNSIQKWRDAILDGSYDAQITGQLQWGKNRREKKEKYENENEDSDQESSSDDSGVEETDEPFESDVSLVLSTRTDGTTEDKKLLETVHSLASALVQVAQSIVPKFLLYPFGPKARCKDRNAIKQGQHIGQKKLLRWEESLMRATSYAQLFLHYHLLYDAMCWARSIELARCMVCRRKGDAKVTLLCDECNRACHMHCLKPKMTKVPKDDWFCKLCRPDETPQGNGRKRTKVIQNLELDSEDDVNSNESEEEEEDTEEEEEGEDGYKDSEESESSSESNVEEAVKQPKIVIQKAAKNQKQKNKVQQQQQQQEKASNKNNRNARATTARKQEQQQSVSRTQSRNPPKRARLSDASESSVKKEKIVERSSRTSGGGRRSSRLSGRGTGEM